MKFLKTFEDFEFPVAYATGNSFFIRYNDVVQSKKSKENYHRREYIMKKWVCPVCGYVHEGDTPPEFCPQCKVPGSKFTEMKAEQSWAAEHVVGVGSSAQTFPKK